MLLLILKVLFKKGCSWFWSFSSKKVALDSEFFFTIRIAIIINIELPDVFSWLTARLLSILDFPTYYHCRYLILEQESPTFFQRFEFEIKIFDIKGFGDPYKIFYIIFFIFSWSKFILNYISKMKTYMLLRAQSPF